ncbi:MAG: DNA polymerase zeta, partial [Paramarteilia canceri]
VADSIIGKAVQILQISINYVNSLYNVYHCKVVYGDTDSIFVEICQENITVQDSFDIAQKLIEGINSQFPWPIKIKLEKIYKPCLLISKKRYVGFAYENKSDSEPKIDDKGIETVRKDSCPFVSTIMRECLEIGFQTGSAFHIRNLLRSYIDSALNYEIGIENFIMTAEVKSSSDHSPDKHTPLAQTIQYFIENIQFLWLNYWKHL